MATRVPEFALLVGVFLGLSAAVSGAVLTGEVFRPLLTGVVVCYPFAAFGVRRSPDPTEALPPRVVLGAGVGVGALTLAASLLERPAAGLVSGLLAGTLVALPPVAYAARYGADVVPLSPARAFLATSVVGAGFVALAPLAGAQSAVLGLVVGLSGALYANARGYRLSRQAEQAGVALGALLGVSVVAVGVLTGRSLAPVVAAGAALVFGPTLFVAVTRGRRGSRGRRRRRRS